MLFKANVVWLLGLLTIVPYSIYNLLFHAAKSEYAFWIVLPLFWVFGYWSLVGPLLATLKIHSVIKTIQAARSREELRAAFSNTDAQETMIELIASENRIPRFLAAWAYKGILKRLAKTQQEPSHKNLPE